MFEFNNLFPEPGRHRFHLQSRIIDHKLALFQLMKTVNPPLRLGGSCLCASAHPFQLPAVQRPALPLCGKHHFFTRRTVFQIDFVIAFVAVKFAAGQLQNHICDPIQEVAVVRYHEDCTAELL